MRICKIEQFACSDLSIIHITQEESEILDEFERDNILLEDNGHIAFGIFSEQYVDYFEQILIKYNVKYKITDLSLTYYKSPSLFSKLFKKYPYKKENIESCIMSSISIDDVLDKINLSGIKSLNEIDKKILIKF